MGWDTCRTCGLAIEEAVSAIAKKKQWKKERATLRAERDTLTQQVTALQRQLDTAKAQAATATAESRASAAEAAVLRSPGAAAKLAAEETVAVSGFGRKGKKVLHLKPAVAEAVANFRA